MINHARTLLMNISPLRANYADSGYEGYEYIPQNFAPVPLSAGLKSIRRALFGENPDSLYRGVRVQELLGYIHQTELADYVYALDPRVTYWPPQVKDTTDRKKIVVTQTYGPARRLFVGGELLPGEKTGVSYRSYIVALGKETADAHNLSVYVRHLEAPETGTLFPFIPPSSPSVPLSESGLVVQVSPTPLRTWPAHIKTEVGQKLIIENFDQIGYGKLRLEPPAAFNVPDLTDIVAQWYVITRALPEPVITSALPVLEKLGETTFLALFGVKPKEPYLTFKNLWEDHPLPAYRLAGLTLALIYRTEEARRSG